MILDAEEIQKILPHRAPFLLVDGIVEMEQGRRIVGVKSVTATEFWVSGHFPGRPMMPAVLVLESLAQTGGILVLLSTEKPESKLLLFAAVDEGRFRHPVVPGDQLRLECEMLNRRPNACKMRGRAFVGDKLVAEGVVLCTITDRDAGGNAGPIAEA